MSLKPTIDAALTATAERLRAGSGAAVLKELKNDVAMIDTSKENLSRRYAGVDPAIALPAVFEAKHPEGDPVAVGKRHDGLVVVFPDSIVVVRGIGFGAREVTVLGKDEISVEPVSLALDGAQLPGLRVLDRRGKPKYAVGVALPDGQGDPAAAQAVRDEVLALLAG